MEIENKHEQRMNIFITEVEKNLESKVEEIDSKVLSIQNKVVELENEARTQLLDYNECIRDCSFNSPKRPV